MNDFVYIVTAGDVAITSVVNFVTVSLWACFFLFVFIKKRGEQ